MKTLSAASYTSLRKNYGKQVARAVEDEVDKVGSKELAGQQSMATPARLGMQDMLWIH